MGAPFSIAAAHLKCYVNNRLLGYVISVPAWQVRTDWGENREIDSLVAKSLSPRLYAVQFTLQLLRGRGTGGIEGAGMATSAENMLRQKSLTVELQDRLTGDIVFKGLRAQVVQQDWQVSPKGLVTGTVQLKAITFLNEATL